MFGQRMIGIDARYFKDALVQFDHPQRAERHAGRHLDVIHVVNLEMAVLLDPVFDEGIAQSMLSLAFGQVSAFHDKTEFAAFVFSHFLRKSGWSAGRWSAF